MVGPFLSDAEKLAAIRDLLPATSAGIHLAVAEAGPLPAETARAMADAAEWEVRTGRASVASRDDAAGRLDEARGALAAILHGDLDSVVIAHSAADALATVALAGGWRHVARSRDLLPAVEARLGALADALGAASEPVSSGAVPAGAEAFVVPHVTASGVVLPVAELARQARAAGTALLVDGSLAAGALHIDVGRIGAAAYAVDTHRWLLGPAAMAAVHVPGPHQRRARTMLEAAPFHAPSVVGMARSAGWLAMYVGLDWIVDRTSALARRLAARLVTIEGIELGTPVPPEAGIVEFRLVNWPADGSAEEELGRRAFAILGRGDGGAIRASVGAWNAEEELDRFADQVALLAAHTPDSLPRRSSLTILHEPGP